MQWTQRRMTRIGFTDVRASLSRQQQNRTGQQQTGIVVAGAKKKPNIGSGGPGWHAIAPYMHVAGTSYRPGRTIAISGSRPWTPYGVWLGRESAASRCYAGYLQYGLAARRSSRAVGCCMLIPSAILRADSEQVDRTRSDCECREK